jgi:hypothetical protein
MPFGASLVAAVAGAGGIFAIIAVSLLASSAAVYGSRPQKSGNAPARRPAGSPR